MHVEISDLIPIIVALISGGVVTGAGRAMWGKVKGRIDKEDQLERELDNALYAIRSLEVDLHFTQVAAINAGINPEDLPPPRRLYDRKRAPHEGA